MNGLLPTDPECAQIMDGTFWAHERCPSYTASQVRVHVTADLLLKVSSTLSSKCDGYHVELCSGAEVDWLRG